MLLFVSLLDGCLTRHATLVDFETGEVLQGKFTDSVATGGTVEIIMPDGEIITGRYSGVREKDEVTFSSATANASGSTNGNSFYGSASTIGSQRTIGGQGKAYALLTSTKPDSKLVIEIIAIYNVLDGHGYGEARTNDGRQYKLQF
jgi:hypothetical protein